MNKNETLILLQKHKAKLVAEYGVITIALFGSTVRDMADSDSDVDILIDFDGMIRYFLEFLFYLKNGGYMWL